MKLLITFLSIFYFTSGFTQNTFLSKNKLKKLFSQNAKGNLFDWNKRKWDDSTNENYKSQYNVWQSINNDSSYYKSDTITMYNYKYAYIELNRNEIKQWTLKKSNEIALSDSKYTEPPIHLTECCFKLKVKKANKVLYLYIYNGGSIIDKFKVLDLGLKEIEKNTMMYILKLKRINFSKKSN